MEARRKGRDVAGWIVPVSGLNVASFRVCCCGRVFRGRVALERRGCAVIMTPLEIKGAVAGVITSVLILVATFTAGGIYRNHIERQTEPGNQPLDAAKLEFRMSEPIVIALSSGSEADITLTAELTDCLPQDSTLIGDKAYDSSLPPQADGDRQRS